MDSESHPIEALSPDELLEKLRQTNDSDILAEIFRRFEKPLADFVRSTVPKYLRNNIGGTLDLTQSVLMDLIKDRHQLASESNSVRRHLEQGEDSQLWHLLVSIVVRHHHKHKKRSQRRPQDFRPLSLDEHQLEPSQVTRADKPETADVIEDFCRQVQLTVNEEIVFVHYWVPRAAGVKPPPTQAQICSEFNLSRRTVERIVNGLKSKVSQYLDLDGSRGSAATEKP